MKAVTVFGRVVKVSGPNVFLKDARHENSVAGVQCGVGQYGKLTPEQAAVIAIGKTVTIRGEINGMHDPDGNLILFYAKLIPVP
jgi:hypothetical protein